MPEALYLAEGIRRIEASARDSSPPLMERAGAAVAELAARLASSKNKDILVLAGPGNNGGDARIAAKRLAEQFFRVTLVTGPSELPAPKNWGLLIDGLFGIGLKRPLEGAEAELVRYANQQSCPILAIDVPSGLDADTGRVLGCAVRATHTLTFIALKPGLLTLDGPDHCGQISVDPLGLDVRKLAPPPGWVAHPELFTGALKKRPGNFHKGLAGSLAVLGGAAGMTGAALLAGRSALKLGAGRVYVGLLDDAAPGADAGALELMLRHADDALGQDLDALVAGPGLGRSDRAETLVGAALASDIPCVLDADGLNLLAESADLRAACSRRSADTVLTPHPAEAGRLLNRKTVEIQGDRIEAARRLAGELNAHVVLKGNGTIIAARDGHWFVNRSGNPGLASAGTGDVLAGMIGALLAQRCSGEAAAVLGVHVHGAAADQCVAEGRGPVGLTAGELLEPARRLLNSWLQ